MGVIVVSIIIVSSSFTFPAKGKYPAEKKGSPEHYSRDAELDYVEDLFFPHDFQGDLQYNFSVPGYLKYSYGHYFSFKEDYRGYALALDQNRSDLPSDYVHANFSISNAKDDYIYTIDNKRIDIGGGATDGIDFPTKGNISVNNTGGCEFFLFKNKDWDNILYEKQSFSFTGFKRSYMLWGINTRVQDYDPQNKFIKVKIHTDEPVRVYGFDYTGKHSGELIDYDEKATKNKGLDFIDKEKHVGLGDEPKIGFSTIDGESKKVNITLKVKILDIPENEWLFPLIVGGAFIGVVGVAIWVSKKEY